MDIVSPATRSRMMAAIGGRNTVPELAVRKGLHAAGLRFRLHRRGLPGSPDIVLPRYRSIVFVHGCFWHRHRGCRFATTPASNAEFWREKFESNVKRDKRQRAALRRLGWRVFTVWECQARSISVQARLIARIRAGTAEASPLARRNVLVLRKG